MGGMPVFLLLLSLMCSLGEEDNLIFIDQDSLIQFTSQYNEEIQYQASPVDKDFSQHIKQKHTTPDGRNIFVYDRVLNTSQLVTLKMYLTLTHGIWSYRIYESYEGGERKRGDNVPWVNEVNVVDFSRTYTSRILQKLVQETSGKSDQVWRPYRAQGKIIRRADFTHIHATASKPGIEFTAAIFLNNEWRKNFYGELYLYDDNEEIIAGSVPHFGRILIWDSSIPYLLRPPSFATGRGQLIFFIHFTKEMNKISEQYEGYQNTVSAREHARQNWFTSPHLGVPNLDAHPNLISEFTSSEGKKIFVFDGLFKKAALDRLRGMIIRHGVYYYDDEEADDSDNVQWIAGFSVDDYIKGYFWNITKQVVKFTSGGRDHWFPYDVSCNLIRSGDHTRIHHDCEPNEDEWTTILYLNPSMVHNDYGETIFYEKNSDDTEIITEVIPKYGRLVVFQGIIPHSARPPSAKFREARLTFVAKLSSNEWIGRLKNLLQDKDHWVSLKQSAFMLQNIAKTGNAEKYLETRSAPSKKYPKGNKEEEDHDDEEDEEDDHGKEQQERMKHSEEHGGSADDRREGDDEEQDRDEERLEQDDEGRMDDSARQDEAARGREGVEEQREMHADKLEAERRGDDEEQDQDFDSADEVNMFLDKISAEKENTEKDPQKIKALQDELETRQKEGLVLALKDIFEML